MSRKRGIQFLIVLSFQFLIPFQSWAQDFELPAIFADHMVLQRQMPIPIWGKAPLGSEVVIQFKGETIKVNADDQGEWKVKFPAMEYGGPFQMTISNGKERIVLKDILIGEVWLCSGQSNMEWPLHKTVNGKEAIPQADNSNIRFFHFKKKHDTYNSPYSDEELTEFSTGNFFHKPQWEVSTSGTATGFSGVAYYFGKELYDSLGIPIGLIQNAVGGSPAQSWISKKSLANHPQLQSLVKFPPNKSWLDSDIIHPWLAVRAKENWAKANISGNNQLPGHPFSPVYLFECAIKPLARFAMRGVIWYQGESNATHPQSYFAMMNELINDWRGLWKQDNFPFYFVQLPKIGNRNLWPEFRQEQAKCLSIFNTGMVVMIDEGHPTDVHPREKKVVGHRLAQLALSRNYDKNLLSESPKLASFYWDKANRKIVLKFNHSYEGMDTIEKQSPLGFSLQGYLENGTREAIVEPTEIQISKDEIILTYSSEFMPTKIKYAWAPAPLNNLINSAGLPLTPFLIELEGIN